MRNISEKKKLQRRSKHRFCVQ